VIALLAAVRTSEYQLLKLKVLDYVPITKDAAHVYIGMACLLLAVTVMRGRLSTWWVLLPGFLVSVLMEAFDFRDDVRAFGHWRVGASLKDVVNTNLLPLVVVFLARRKWLRQ
jgi:hypothetical protein